MNEPDENKIKSFSIRTEKRIYEKLMAEAGKKSLNELINEIIISHLNEPQQKIEQTTQTELLKQIELKNEIIRAKDQTIKVLENQNGFLIIEFQKMSSVNEKLLMPSPEEQQGKRNAHFWEFWKS